MSNNFSILSNKNNIRDDQIEIIEGSARMIYDKKEAVFYNKVQVMNRDISIQVIRLFAEKLEIERANKKTNHESGITILDALAATGLRSVRYLKEIPNVRHITINDLSSDATAVALNNCSENGVDMSKIKVENKDASMLMYENRHHTRTFDVIGILFNFI
jgi:tRNA (guanine26-N2/guanine27-N2)-dimethyltransferase